LTVLAGLLAALVLVPLIEIYVLIQVGQVLGALPTIALLVAMSVIGAWLLRREGTRAWFAFRGALQAGRVPGTEIADGALVIFGGALLLTPGFATDVVGLLCVLPGSRAALRRALTAFAMKRFGLTGMAGAMAVDQVNRRRTRPRSQGPVVDGSVVDGSVVEPPGPSDPPPTGSSEGFEPGGPDRP
jgi:UPF0716 protein FxsA